MEMAVSEISIEAMDKLMETLGFEIEEDEDYTAAPRGSTQTFDWKDNEEKQTPIFCWDST